MGTPKRLREDIGDYDFEDPFIDDEEDANAEEVEEDDFEEEASSEETSAEAKVSSKSTTPVKMN